MKIKLTVKKEFDVKFLKVDAGVRYWEDGEVNGIRDETGAETPFKKVDRWEPLIDIDKGMIIAWPTGVIADLHYKVCDDGQYALLDEDMKKITEIDGYVPDIMSPEDEGYGDYIIMKIDGDGKINKWDKELISKFTEDEDE